MRKQSGKARDYVKRADSNFARPLICKVSRAQIAFRLYKRSFGSDMTGDLASSVGHRPQEVWCYQELARANPHN